MSSSDLYFLKNIDSIPVIVFFFSFSFDEQYFYRNIIEAYDIMFLTHAFFDKN